MTKDHVPVITHSHELHGPSFRGSDGKFLNDGGQRVSSLQMTDLVQFDIGRLDGQTEYGKRFPDQAQLDGVRVPRLGELLQLVSQPKYDQAHLMLELKSDPKQNGDSSKRDAFVSAVISEVRNAGLADRTLLHSFDWSLLAECQRQQADMPVSFLTQICESANEAGEGASNIITPDFHLPGSSIPDEVIKAGGSLWCPYYKDIIDTDLARARALGLCVAVWTVNEVEDIDRMIDLHVDAIITDYPGRVQRRLSDRGYKWQD